MRIASIITVALLALHVADEEFNGNCYTHATATMLSQILSSFF